MALVDKYVTLTISRSALPPAPTVRTIARVSNVALDGSARSESFETIAAAQAALTASRIDQDTFDAIVAIFAQRPRPSKVEIIRVDVSGGEGYNDALIAAEAAGVKYNGVIIDSRTAADIVAASNFAEARDVIFMFQSSLADWLTSGAPSSFSAITSNEHTFGVYHSTDTVQADAGVIGSRLAYDPNASAAPGFGPVRGVTQYTITSAQRDFALANGIGVLEEYVAGGTGNLGTNYTNGKSLAGIRMDALVTEFWLKQRIEGEVAALLVNEAAAGRFVPVSPSGQSQVGAILRATGQRGVAIGRFTGSDDFPEGFVVTAPDITTADKSAQRIPMAATYNLAIPALAVSISIDLTE